MAVARYPVSVRPPCRRDPSTRRPALRAALSLLLLAVHALTARGYAAVSGAGPRIAGQRSALGSARHAQGPKGQAGVGAPGRLSAGGGAQRRRLGHVDARWRFEHVIRHRKRGECWSRHEQHLFYKDPPATAELEDALLQYEGMHQRCTNISDWGAYADLLFWDKQKDREEHLRGCKYLIYDDPLGHGAGNRIMNLVSTFVYALLSGRALIVKPNSPMLEYFCNPFRYSNWTLDEAKWRPFIDNVWRGVRRMKHMEGGKLWDGWDDRRIMDIGINWDSGEIASTFFCPESQRNVFAKIPVITIQADEYFVPGLYFVPEFEALLQRWAPDGKVFTHVSRFLLHPSNRVWLRVVRFYQPYLAHHTRLVGVQTRAFWPCADPVEERILHCAFNVSRALPRLLPPDQYLSEMEEQEGGEAEAEAQESIGVFMTGLNRTYSDVLADYLNSGVPRGGQALSVSLLSHEGREKHDYHQYETAIVEMLLLSLCDTLLVTDYSTFGYVAAGLAGYSPWSMNIVVTRGGDFRTNGRPVCQPVSPEPCFIRFPASTLKCADFTKPVTEVNPNVGHCEGVGTGLQQKVLR